MKLLLLLVVLTLLPFSSGANVDMVMGDTANNELVIAWSYNNSAFAGKYTGSGFAQVVGIPGFNTGVVTVAEGEQNSRHILFLPSTQREFSDPEIILSYSYSNFGFEDSLHLNNLGMFTNRFGFLKSADERWDALLAYSYMEFTSSFAELMVKQTSYSVTEQGELATLAEASWETRYYHKHPATEVSYEYPTAMAGPVVCPGGYPLVATSFGNNGSVQHWLVAHSLSFNPDSTALLVWAISESWDPVVSGVMGLGCSSDSDAVLLFADETGDINWSHYTAYSPEPDLLEGFQWDSPAQGDPVAFTSTFELPGMLMVWYSDGEIRCRHWNGQWNSYDYFIANSLYPPDPEEIAVCADTDGYWVAWLPGIASEPEVVFVDFDDVTSVHENTNSPIESRTDVRPLSSPVEGLLSVNISGVSSGTVTVHDISGRTVYKCRVSEEGVHRLLEPPAPGVYFIVLQSSSGESSCRVVCI